MTARRYMGSSVTVTIVPAGSHRTRLGKHVYCTIEYVYSKKGVHFRMKQKLTITVDAELLPKAKRHARSRGVSLSSLVEKALRQVAGDQAPSFATRWRGRFRAAGRDDPRYDALARKYLQ